MKTLNLILLFVVISVSCSDQKMTEAELDEVRQSVIDNDLAFSRFAEKHGFPKALAEYAADDVIKLNPRQYSVFGKHQLQREAAADSIGSAEGTLTWKPLKVHVAASGDMAAAFGDWYFNFKSSKTTLTPRFSETISLFGKSNKMDHGNLYSMVAILCRPHN